MIPDARAEKALGYLVESAMDAAQARADAEHLEHMRQVMLARIAGQFEGAEAKRDRLARASDEYEEFLIGLRAAKEKAYFLQNKRVAEEAVVEAWRTSSANVRRVS